MYIVWAGGGMHPPYPPWIRPWLHLVCKHLVCHHPLLYIGIKLLITTTLSSMFNVMFSAMMSSKVMVALVACLHLGSKMATQQSSVWLQKEISLKARKRGCYLITDEIENLDEIKQIKIGLCHILSKLFS